MKTFKIIGINENYMGIKILKINEDGRYFNKGDDENTRNVTIDVYKRQLLNPYR